MIHQLCSHGPSICSRDYGPGAQCPPPPNFSVRNTSPRSTALFDACPERAVPFRSWQVVPPSLLPLSTRARPGHSPCCPRARWRWPINGPCQPEVPIGPVLPLFTSPRSTIIMRSVRSVSQTGNALRKNGGLSRRGHWLCQTNVLNRRYRQQ